MINLDQLLAYQDARERELLKVRVRPMIRVGNELTTADALTLVRGLGPRSGLGDDWLCTWDLKFVMDGGSGGRRAGAALRQRPGPVRPPELPGPRSS
jgi:hypothetical protein